MDKKTINRLIIFNLILSGFVILDLCLPGTESNIKKLESIYGSTASTGTARKPIIEAKTVMLLESGELYYIGKSPDEDYVKGQKLKLVKSAIFKNVNEIIVLENNYEKDVQVGLFSNIWLSILFRISILISILNIFIKNNASNIALVASMMFITIISMIYIFYY
ncbi:hypothetical protein FNO01nite_33980 [Flavobacterium noncentrifugens]|uniref:Uncharacterized protein n=1 Tax=Flavobacterium noncentrifugens TaxID=1128970 RepID=A0A1G9DCK4_9FLAO|nr:hypothetical protein [Flavobacterium noncentrifugens]GEP52726.1 hypothetical protein FNO01nite_33980 [Flavobacterium noncentrifugens]SDK61638.1 hypothetical protein SAMN04487935_3781 [Flavobacterium noncentrifugens]